MEITDIYKYKRIFYDNKHTLTEGSPYKVVLMILDNKPYFVDIPKTDDKKQIEKYANLVRGRVFYRNYRKVENPKKRGSKPKPKTCNAQA